MDERRIEILMEAIRRRREELAEAKKPESVPAESKRVVYSPFTELLKKRHAQHEVGNPFREPDKRFGGGQRKKKKKEKK